MTIKEVSMKKLILVCIFLLAASSAYGAACEVITVAGTSTTPTAATITPSSHAGYTYAFCSVATAPIRFRTDGTAPTASVGLAVEVGQAFLVDDREELLGLGMIRQGSTSASVTCCYR